MVRSWVVVAFALSVPWVAVAAPAAVRTPFRARCDVSAGDPVNTEWMTWSRKAIAFMQGEVDFSSVKRLAVTDAARTTRMLRLGLAACDPLAAQAINVTKLHALLPELKDLLDPANVGGSLLFGRDTFASFRVQVVLAANTLEPATDYGAYLIPVLSAPDTMVRIHAAMGARHFHRESVSKALLATVARDGSYLVRFHAADSLLALAGVYPQDIADHGAIFDRLKGGGDSLDSVFGQTPSAADLARYAQAARMLEDLIAANSPGKCSTPIRPTITHVKVHRVNPHVVAVEFDATESSCGTEPALVMFVESTNGFCGLVSEVQSPRDPTKVELGTPSGDIVVEYARATRIARVRGVEIGKGENVALLAVSADGGTTPKWRGRLDTKTTRGGDVVQALLAQSAALRKMVQP